MLETSQSSTRSDHPARREESRVPRTDDTPARNFHPPAGRPRRSVARAIVPTVAVLCLSLIGSPAAAEEVEEAAFEQYVALGASLTARPYVIDGAYSPLSL